MLTLFANDARRPFPCAFSVRSIERLSDLYRAGNGGTCGVVLGEDGQRSACGSRFVICLNTLCDYFLFYPHFVIDLSLRDAAKATECRWWPGRRRTAEGVWKLDFRG